MAIIPKKPEGVEAATWPSLLIGLFVAFGGILYGYDTGLISGIQQMPYWRTSFAKPGETAPSSGDISLIVGILSVGTFVGALAAGRLADMVGRRLGIVIATGVVFNFGVILMTAATAQPLFIAGRFFAGLGVGLVSAQVPMYQSEVLLKHVRGAIVGCYQWAITVGLLVAACVNYGTKDLDSTASYRVPVAIQFLWSLILMTGMLLLPETPRYLIKRGNMEAARKSLCKLRRLPADHPEINSELNEIQSHYQLELSVGVASYTECFKAPILKRLLTGCALQSLQQLTGVNFIFYYGTTYFKNSGFGDQPFLIQIVTNAVNVVTTLPGLWAVDKFGRRPVLLIGALGMAISQYIVAITGTVVVDPSIEAQNVNQAASGASIAFVCIFIAFFASTWGPSAWVVTSEVFPLSFRAKCLSMTTASNWLLNFVIAFVTPYLVDADAANLRSKVFFIWGTACWVCAVFVYTCIYETKNLTLEEVDTLYHEVGRAWKSRGWKPPALRAFEEEKHMGGGAGAEFVEDKNGGILSEKTLQ